MATISRFLFWRHVRSDPSVHLVHYRRGAPVRSGRGLAFWFLPHWSSVAEVPLDDRDQAFLFKGRSSDFQEVTVQGVVCAVGQDGLVANAAKYLAGQVVVGLNPEPDRYEGVLVPHPPAAADLLRAAAAGRGRLERRTRVAAELDDGQWLVALNELFLGHRTHQSARYRISWAGAEEEQSSSGVIVATGTGATGWARSVRRNRVSDVALPDPTEPRLAFFVREAWPSKATGVALTDGALGPGQAVEVTSRMNDDGVVFGDGVEADRLELPFGRRARLGLAGERLHLLAG